VSFWAGIDGFNSGTVEQDGTAVSCEGGTPHHYAWHELCCKQPEVKFSGAAVAVGDRITSIVTFSGGKYVLTLKNATKGWTKTSSGTIGGQRSSVEAIAEAPSLCSTSCTVQPLANFGTVHFTSTTANGQPFGSLSPIKINMAGSGHLKASTSALSGGTAFSVTFLRST
jgi:hypothetical protein